MCVTRNFPKCGAEIGSGISNIQCYHDEVLTGEKWSSFEPMTALTSNLYRQCEWMVVWTASMHYVLRRNAVRPLIATYFSSSR